MRHFRSLGMAGMIVVLVGCGPSQSKYDELKKENESLRAELGTVKKEMEEIKFGPGKLLSAGIQQLSSNKYEDAKGTFELLIKKHPSTKEAVEAASLLTKASVEIEKKREKDQAEEKKVAREKEARLAEATRKMSKDYDKVEGITWYKDASTHPYFSSLHLYYGKKGSGSPWLRMRLRYYGDDWVFAKSFVVVADGQRYERNNLEFQHESGSGSVWESFDESASDADLTMVKAVISSKEAILRFSGDQHNNDHQISSQEKKALQNVLDAYVASGGKI